MIPRVPTFLFLAYLASVCLADDFKTTNGKEYKNATVSRVEPDGIVLKTKSGVTKLYFGELPKEVQERFRYDPAQAGQFNAAQQGAVTQQNAAMAEQQQQQEQRRRAQEIKKNSEAIKKNVWTVQQVESDQPSFLDQPLLLGALFESTTFTVTDVRMRSKLTIASILLTAPERVVMHIWDAKKLATFARNWYPLAVRSRACLL
jgi:hypothetical protein